VMFGLLCSCSDPRSFPSLAKESERASGLKISVERPPGGLRQKPPSPIVTPSPMTVILCAGD
jgi:hypothetical protein